ncbi:MAG: ATP-dependent helicase [Candidatus Brocadiia bacterium]
MSQNATDPISENLSSAQKEAVTYGDGPLLVVAGAGSGKTRVITRRIAWLVQNGVAADRIVAITFTNKAADEMKRRVENLVGENVMIRTFHSLCAWILRRDADRVGLSPSFSIYDRRDSSRIVRQIIKQKNLDRETYKPSDIRDCISAHKDKLENPDEADQEAVGVYDREAAEIYRCYNERLLENNALDFDDLLVKTVELFSKSPEVLSRYQKAYQHVLVDEYQDTNLPQHLIARALQGYHRNITAVGDPDQTIYTWRGARLDNIMEFEEDFPGAHIIKLEQNYRSTANILRAASTCVSFNKLRHEKVLRTESESGEPVNVIHFPDSYEEANWIAEEIQTLIEGGTPAGEIALLYRTKYQSLQLEETLMDKSVPHQVVDTIGFFERKEIKDICAYLRLIMNPHDDVAFRRIVNVPTRGIGPKTLERVENIAANAGKAAALAIQKKDALKELPTRARNAVDGFAKLYKKLTKLDANSIYELIKTIVDETEYIQGAPDEERDDVHEIIDYLLGFAKQYDKRHPGGDLVSFMERTALISDADGWESSADAVSLMTLHSAKGLEFDAVFIVGLEKDLLPHQRALEDNRHGETGGALEEERRLLHVGMTRARYRLYLTHARERMIRGRDQPTRPSRFLDELPHEGVQHETIGGDPSFASASLFGKNARAVKKRKKRSKKARLQSGGKGPVLKVLDGSGEFIEEGSHVEHASYGEGEVLGISKAGKYQKIRIDFSDHGVLTIVAEIK